MRNPFFVKDSFQKQRDHTMVKAKQFMAGEVHGWS